MSWKKIQNPLTGKNSHGNSPSFLSQNFRLFLGSAFLVFHLLSTVTFCSEIHHGEASGSVLQRENQPPPPPITGKAGLHHYPRSSNLTLVTSLKSTGTESKQAATLVTNDLDALVHHCGCRTGWGRGGGASDLTQH